MATVFTYRFIKESNGNVIIQWLRNGQPFQRFSVQPEKDIRVSLTANGQVIIPIDNNGGIAGEATLAVPFERIDFVNSVPSSANPASPDDAVAILGEDFFFELGGSGGDTYWEIGDPFDTGTNGLVPININETLYLFSGITDTSPSTRLAVFIMGKNEQKSGVLIEGASSKDHGVKIIGSSAESAWTDIVFKPTNGRIAIGNLPTYADDAADADTNLPTMCLYKLPGDRTIYQKP